MDLNPFFSYTVTSIGFLSSVKSLMLKIRILTEAFQIFSILVMFLSSMNPLIVSFELSMKHLLPLSHT